MKAQVGLFSRPAASSDGRPARRAFVPLAWLLAGVAGSVLVCLAFPSAGQQPAGGTSSRSAGISMPPLPTLGGQVFWSDQIVFRDWRIQRNTLSGTCRLLDGENRCYEIGTLEACQEALERLKQQLNLPPMEGKLVLLLHGLGSVRLVAADMAQRLHTEGGYKTICLSYPSQFEDIASHAKSLGSVIEHLDGVSEINLVAHSLGNLVIRHYLADAAAAGKSDVRIRRIVMLAPPNNGSELLAKYGDNPLIRLTHGTAGQQIGRYWPQLAPHLAIPQCEFGIIAGGRGANQGMLAVLDGDNDGLVTVASTRLPGASDFIVVPAAHVAQFYSEDIQRYTLSFLQHGYFVSEARRQAIPR